MLVCVPFFSRVGEVGGEEAIVTYLKPDEQFRHQFKVGRYKNQRIKARTSKN